MKMDFSDYFHYLQKSKNILISLLIGSLGGVIVMLLLAPQSGKSTRTWISQKITAFLD